MAKTVKYHEYGNVDAKGKPIISKVPKKLVKGHSTEEHTTTKRLAAFESIGQLSRALRGKR